MFKCHQCKTLTSTKNCKRVLNGISNNRLGNIFQSNEDARLININPNVSLGIGNNNANLNNNNNNLVRNNNNINNTVNLINNNNSEDNIIENISVPLNPIPIPINELDFVIYQNGKKKAKPASKEVEEILKLFPYLQKKETRGKMLFYRSSTHEFMNPTNINNLNVHMSDSQDMNLNSNDNLVRNDNNRFNHNTNLIQNQNLIQNPNLIQNQTSNSDKENFRSPLTSSKNTIYN